MIIKISNFIVATYQNDHDESFALACWLCLGSAAFGSTAEQLKKMAKRKKKCI